MISVDVVHSFLRKKETGNMIQMPASGILAIKNQDAPVSRKTAVIFLTAVLHDINIAQKIGTFGTDSFFCYLSFPKYRLITL